jgi:hypothetical protein
MKQSLWGHYRLKEDDSTLWTSRDKHTHTKTHTRSQAYLGYCSCSYSGCSYFTCSTRAYLTCSWHALVGRLPTEEKSQVAQVIKMHTTCDTVSRQEVVPLSLDMHDLEQLHNTCDTVSRQEVVPSRACTSSSKSCMTVLQVLKVSGIINLCSG